MRCPRCGGGTLQTMKGGKGTWDPRCGYASFYRVRKPKVKMIPRSITPSQLPSNKWGLISSRLMKLKRMFKRQEDRKIKEK